MPMSAAGSPESRRNGGFTLIELLVVVAIIAMVSLGVVLSQRGGGEVQLQREAERLAALLESARARSQYSGEPVLWRAMPDGFRFDGLREKDLPQHWLDPDTVAPAELRLLLGPEPVIGAQTLEISSRRNPRLRQRIGTDGLGPFALIPPAP